MKNVLKDKLPLIFATGLLGFSLILATTIFAATANAAASTTQSSTTTTTLPKTLSDFISKGDADISVRLTTLNSLSGVISSTTNKLTSSDRAYLPAEVNSEISGLTALKTQLDGETTVSATRTDFQNIFLDYRVYALVAPKVTMIKAADDQQATQAKLNSLTTKLQTRINNESAASKNVSQLQTWLNSMKTETSDAQSISSSIETGVLQLLPSQYDSNHAILSGDFAQLKQARSDNISAANYAQQIVSALKKL